jgi:hypothetical protein
MSYYLGERSQVPHHIPVSKENQSVETKHIFNRCPFVDDRLKQLLKEEVMNIHQHVLPTTIIVVPNVSIFTNSSHES